MEPRDPKPSKSVKCQFKDLQQHLPRLHLLLKSKKFHIPHPKTTLHQISNCKIHKLSTRCFQLKSAISVSINHWKILKTKQSLHFTTVSGHQLSLLIYRPQTSNFLNITKPNRIFPKNTNLNLNSNNRF